MTGKTAMAATQLGEYARNASVFPAKGLGAAYRLGLVGVSVWSFGSPSLADVAKEDPLVARAQEQAQSC